MRLPAVGSSVWVDGERVPAEGAAIPIDDPTAHAGLGLFETLAIDRKRAVDLEAHLERMSDGARRLGIPLPKLERLRSTAEAAAADEAAACAWLKIVATAGGRTFVFTGALDPQEIGRAATAVILPWRRSAHDALAGIKSCSYAANAIGLERARSMGADEGLWRNTKGLVCEGCTSNVFVVRGRRLFTPSLREGPLPGIVRAVTLRAARHLGYVIHEGKLRVEAFRRADEAFLTSSLRGVRPLVAVDGRPVGHGTPGPRTARLAEEVKRLRGIVVP